MDGEQWGKREDGISTENRLRKMLCESKSHFLYFLGQ